MVRAAGFEPALQFAQNGGKHSVSHTSSYSYTHLDTQSSDRVSPDLTRLGDLKLSEVVNDSQGLSSTPSDLKELAVLKVRLDAAIAERDMIRAERERERRQMQEQIENLQSSLATAQEQGSKALLLLTNQTGEKQGDQSQQLKELAKNVELVKRQNNHLNKKLKAQEIKAQESRTFWQWLVGPSRKTSEKPKETELSKAS